MEKGGPLSLPSPQMRFWLDAKGNETTPNLGGAWGRGLAVLNFGVTNCFSSNQMISGPQFMARAYCLSSDQREEVAVQKQYLTK